MQDKLKFERKNMSRKISNRHVGIVNLLGILRQSYGMLKVYYPQERVDRSFNQIYKTNNWLKRHGYTKRRKPFVRGWVLEEEYVKILVEMKRMGLPVDKEIEEERQWRKKTGRKDLDMDMEERNIIVCDSKGDIFKQANVLISGVRGEGKSFFEQKQTLQLLKDSGFDLKEIKLNGEHGWINPFDISISEKTLEEKEQQLRTLLEVIEYDKELILHYLQDMSFLDDNPEWKERATAILQEYVR